MRRAILLLAAALSVLALAAPAAAYQKPLNWRLRKKKPAVQKSTETAAGAEPEASTEAAKPKGPPPLELMRGRWTPEAREAIDRLIAEKGKTSPSYDPKVPPVAVLPWSDALVSGDPAELVFLRLTTEAKFRVDEEWWTIVPIAYGRQPIRAAYEQFISLSTDVWTAQPTYHAWRKGMLASYLGLCRSVGRKECRSYLTRLWAGYRIDEAEDYAKKALDDEKRTAATFELIPGEASDPQPLRARRGLRVIPEMRDLARKLLDSGFDVWVVDDLPQPVLTAASADYGIDPTRAYGVHNSTAGARLGAGVLIPVPTRGGKTDVVQNQLGRPADFVLGRDSADLDVLSYGDGLRVVLDVDRELARKARERGWLIQPAFAR